MDYYTHVRLKNEFNAGNKATDDVARICQSLGMQEIVFPKLVESNNKLISKIWIFAVAFYVWFSFYIKVKKGDTLLFQHPMYGIRMANYYIRKIKRKGCKCIAIIHDLETLRNNGENAYIISSTTSNIADDCLLRQFDVVICHNRIMHDYLVSKEFDNHKLVDLDLFDYLSEYEPNNEVCSNRFELVIAGNLSRKKSSYIYELIEQLSDLVELHTYGVGFEEQNYKPNIHYEGAFPPDELCSKIKGMWGIVWDGPSAKSCIGNTGNYLKYNNPHKLSLYVASQIPVVVWDQSAASIFVKDYNIGITVDSLINIEDKLNSVSSEEYNIMVKNIMDLSKNVRTGYFFKRAYNKAKEIIAEGVME